MDKCASTSCHVVNNVIVLKLGRRQSLLQPQFGFETPASTDAATELSNTEDMFQGLDKGSTEYTIQQVLYIWYKYTNLMIHAT